MQKKEKRTALVGILVTTRMVNYAGSATRINRHGCPRLIYDFMFYAMTFVRPYPKERASVV